VILSGLRVVELAVWVAGPGAGGVLADWGAEVVKIEPPEGDPCRSLFMALAGLREPKSPPFDLDNRGKRSVVLDTRDPEARRLARRLVVGADVFVTNLRPDALASARALPLVERGHDPRDQGQRGHVVAEAAADAVRLDAGREHDVLGAGARPERADVVGRAIALRAAQSVAGDAPIHQPGTLRSE